MTVVYPYKKHLPGEPVRKSRMVPVDAMELLQAETQFFRIEGEGREGIEVFLIASLFSFFSQRHRARGSSGILCLPSVSSGVCYANDFGIVEWDAGSATCRPSKLSVLCAV